MPPDPTALAVSLDVRIEQVRHVLVRMRRLSNQQHTYESEAWDYPSISAEAFHVERCLIQCPFSKQPDSIVTRREVNQPIKGYRKIYPY